MNVDTELLAEAEQIYQRNPGAAADLRAERLTLEQQRRTLERQLSTAGGLDVAVARTKRDIDAHTSPEIERLRDLIDSRHKRIDQAAQSLTTEARQLRNLHHKGFDPRTYPAPGTNTIHDLFNQAVQLVTESGRNIIGVDTD